MKSKTLKKFADEGKEVLNEVESKEILREYNIPCPNETMIEFVDGKDGEEYVNDLKEKGMPDYPLYLKVVSHDITSKTDANGIEKVNSDEEAAKAINRIFENAKKYDKEAEIEGILASEDASNQTREVFLGSTVDKHFGHIISLGFGGVHVEVYQDVEFRVIPIEENDVQKMIDNLKGKEMLKEFRGMKAVNQDSLVDTTLKLSKLVEENPEIKEIDINPLLVGPEGNVAVDALVRISS